jgi:ATP-dependent Clp protease ATP-binding subunit ClpA
MTMPFCRTERICSATLDNGTGDVTYGTGSAESADAAPLPQREPGSSEAIAAQADPSAADPDMLRKILDRLNRILDPRYATCGPVFVGRRDEMAALVALLQRAEEGQPGFAIIAGEAGVGKTRLAAELADQAVGRGFMVLTGQCVELGTEGLPLAPLINALRMLAHTMALMSWPRCSAC